MKYDSKLMQSDIIKYGLYSYNDFSKYISKNTFDEMNVKYFKVGVGKGLTTFEEVVEAMQIIELFR